MGGPAARSRWNPAVVAGRNPAFGSCIYREMQIISRLNTVICVKNGKVTLTTGGTQGLGLAGEGGGCWGRHSRSWVSTQRPEKPPLPR